jgi:tRNA A37 threonylcarbamoyladenosine dehydratase|tara:strand:+ start:25 stop:465 length:441 start_codon:yes stop_codon:yes gene_type:complete
MAITINGTGTITGLSAGGLPDGTVDTDMIAASAVNRAKLAVNQQKELAKAWLLVSLSGTLSITDSHNISSVTDQATGRYVATLTNAMTDSDYVVLCGAAANTNTSVDTWANAYERTSTTFTVQTQNSSSSNVDRPTNYAVVFGVQA